MQSVQWVLCNQLSIRGLVYESMSCNSFYVFTKWQGNNGISAWESSSLPIVFEGDWLYLKVMLWSFQSHEFNEAHWDGECGLPPGEKEGYMMQALMDHGSEDSVCDGMEDLLT